MFDELPTEIRDKLWDHQATSVDFAIHHLNTESSPCLIRMPTGTGKTGIVACLTLLSNKGKSLVLTPWAALRNQMVADITTGFWSKLDLPPSELEVSAMVPSNAKQLLDVMESRVFVATFAALNQIRRTDEATYQKLENSIDLVIVDEGHYEPAVEWGKSVKGLSTRTVLLTATPYRNDLKLFRITDPKKSTHHFTHDDALKNRIIRDLQFETLDAKLDIASLSEAFVKRWNSLKRSNRLPSRHPRAIICCADSTEIEETVIRLQTAGISAIGLHDKFGGTTKLDLVQTVPDPRQVDAEVWVHQHKLTEGLDDHRFCCVALFCRIRNDRKLIQQIGRILRLDSEDRKYPALVLAPEEFSRESQWEAYLEFETQLELLDPKHYRNVVDQLLSSQPSVEYFDGRFRKRFNPEDIIANPQVVIPPSVLVRQFRDGFSLDSYIEDCTDTLNTEDAVILGPEMNAPCQRSDSHALWIYASIRNSRFLNTTSLYEIRLETHCVVVAGDYVFMTDSSGLFPKEYLEKHTSRVPAQRISRFLAADARPTHVSVDSSIPYDTVIRGAELRGHNLLSIPSSLTDRIHICRAARGSLKNAERRYIGINKGRIRKEVSREERQRFNPDTFISWAQDVGAILDSKAPANVIFQRYMPTCAPPENPIPRAISLDTFRFDLCLTLADGTACSLKNSSSKIEASGMELNNSYTCSFDLETSSGNDSSIDIGIKYQHSKQRFWFSKDGGDTVRVSIEEDESSATKSLIDFLNLNQDITLIGLEGGEIVYQGRNFYKIDYTFAEDALLGLINPLPDVAACCTEKGSKAQVSQLQEEKADGFPDRSLYKALTEGEIGLPFEPNVFICDDMATESADFVAANFDERKLALIHVKVGKGTKVSASAFHDVVAQAMKNLVYLTRNSPAPDKISSWRRSSTWNRTGIPRLIHIPDGFPTAKSLWEKIQSEIVISSNPELFVVLLTSGCCDLNELRDAVRSPEKRTSEVGQLLHLLDGLNNYSGQLGVRLIVYDIPYENAQR